MALEAVMGPLRQGLGQIAKAIRDHAARQAWGTEAFRVFARVNPTWGQIHILVVVKELSREILDEQRLALLHHLRSELGDLVDAISLTLRSDAQVQEGGIYSIGPQFTDIDDLIVSLGAAGQIPGGPLLG